MTKLSHICDMSVILCVPPSLRCLVVFHQESAACTSMPFRGETPQTEAAAFRGWPEAVRASNTHCMWSYIGANMGNVASHSTKFAPIVSGMLGAAIKALSGSSRSKHL